MTKEQFEKIRNLTSVSLLNAGPYYMLDCTKYASFSLPEPYLKATYSEKANFLILCRAFIDCIGFDWYCGGGYRAIVFSPDWVDWSDADRLAFYLSKLREPYSGAPKCIDPFCAEKIEHYDIIEELKGYITVFLDLNKKSLLPQYSLDDVAEELYLLGSDGKLFQTKKGPRIDVNYFELEKRLWKSGLLDLR